MEYTKHNFKDGAILSASQLNEMDEQIAQNELGVGRRKIYRHYIKATLREGSDGTSCEFVHYSDYDNAYSGFSEELAKSMVSSCNFAPFAPSDILPERVVVHASLTGTTISLRCLLNVDNGLFATVSFPITSVIINSDEVSEVN